MNLFRNLKPVARKLSIVMLILLLLSAFLFLYYFKYVPANKEWLHQQGFLILNQHEKGIQQNIMDLKSFFCTKKTIFLNKGLPKNNPDTSINDPFNYEVSNKKGRKGKTSVKDTCDPLIDLDLDKEKAISFQFNSPSDSFKFKVSLNNISEKILNTERPDFFQSYFIICQHHAEKPEQDKEEEHVDKQEQGKKEHAGKQGQSNQEEHEKPHVLYHSADLPVSEQLQQDSIGTVLLSTQFSKIISLEISGSKFRVFMLPFQLEHNSLILAGLIKEKDYNERLQNIPFGMVSGIIIIFIFILISLPYIKIFLFSPSEHFGLRDIVFLGISLFIGTALLLIMLQQILMQTGARLRTKDELYSLSDSIQKNFHREITLANTELKLLDTLLKKRIDSNSKTRQNTKDSSQSTLIVKRADRPSDRGYNIPLGDSSFYLNYTGVQWADSKGNQLYKGYLDREPFSFSKIDYRQYFKDVNKRHLYSSSVLNNPVDSFAIQPVYSMSTNAFEVNIAIPSNIKAKDCKMTALSAHMPSVMNTIFPKGYGFYIIDNSGLILFQSEGAVTLQENFLEWINDQHDLSYTMQNRQSRFISNQYINNKLYSLFIRPVDNLPWHLVVYHCNDYTTASILHVSSFTLFFLLILFSMLLLFCLVAWNKTNYFTRLHQPVYQYDWFKPGKDKSTFLFSANTYLISYTAITLIYGLFMHHRSVFLFIGLLFPLFTVYTLYIIFRQHVLKQPVPTTARAVFGFIMEGYNIIALLFLLLLNMVYFRLETNTVSGYAFIFYEVISTLMLFFMIGIFPRYMKKNEQNGDILKQLYCSFWFLSVIAISLVPAHCFFQYAQEKEMVLMVKTGQLGLAQKIEERLLKFDWFDKVLKTRHIPLKQKKSILFMQGIYPITDQNGFILDTVHHDLPNQIDPEPYDTILRSISWNYRSFDKIIPFQNHADDNQWSRQDFVKGNPFQMTLIYNLRSELNEPDTITNVKSLQITNCLPEISRYYRMHNFKSLFLVFLLSFVLFVIFFRLLQTVVNRLLMIGYLNYGNDPAENEDNLIRKQVINSGYSTTQKIEKVLNRNDVKNENKYKSLKEVWEKEYAYERMNKIKMADLEDRILFNQYHLSEFYEEIWKSCDDQEKYFLYDMARDSFINYKNTQMVQRLLYKGILVPYEQGVRIMSVSFRNYILEKEGDKEITTLKDQFQTEGTWGKIRTPVLVGITAIGIFLFVTQEDLLQRVAALVPTFSAIVGLGTLILGSKTKSVDPK